MTAKAKQLANQNFEKIIERTVKKAINEAVLYGFEKGKTVDKDLFCKTETRLRAYKELKDNVKKYTLDIEDLKREQPGRSKDIVRFGSAGNGTRLTLEEIQEARIIGVQKKIERDQPEIDEIDFALQAISGDKYYDVVTMKYFEGKNDDEIAEVMFCDSSTVRRNKNRLVRKIMVKLYGADAVT